MSRSKLQQSDFWLPNALNSGTYAIVRRDSVDGVPCVVVANDRDELSIADSHSFVIVRRKFRRPEINQLVKCEARDLREVAPDLWVPFEQTRVTSQLSAGDEKVEALTTMILQVTNVETGTLRPKQLDVEIPADVKEYEDFVKGVNFLRPDRGSVSIAFQTVQSELRQDVQTRWIRIALFCALAVGLFIGSFIIWRRRAD